MPGSRGSRTGSFSRRRFIVAAALPVSARFLLAQDPANDDVILRAMRDELDRSRQLRVAGGGDVPYFISYMLSDSEDFTVTATFGAATRSSRTRFRVPLVEVRVGSYDFDNTGHVSTGAYSGTRYDTQSWPLDDNYEVLREHFWLSTDRAFKAALESIAAKRASLNNVTAATDIIADFSKVTPVQSIGKKSAQKVDDAAWTSRVVKLSSVFNSYPEVLSSAVELQAGTGTTYLMNSEGSAIRYSDNLTSLYARAEGQTPDGMILHDGLSFQAIEIGDFPSDDEVRKGLTEIADNIRALSHAPTGEAYSGPVLFEPQAAAQLFAQLLGDNLRLNRRLVGAGGGRGGPGGGGASSEFETRVGSRVLPEWMDVTDDPNQTTWQGKPLAGHYPFDLEGTKPQAVNVIEKGVLKSFLTTRTPVKGFPASNGHARLPGPGGSRAATIGNLFVKASQTSPLADLKKKLMDMCKEQSKPYGMLVRKLDYPFTGSASELQGGPGGGRAVTPPVLMYRVYPDGREELVRGMRFQGLVSRSLRDIAGASQETALFGFVGYGGGGYTAPAAVIAPGILMEDLELEPRQDQLPKPAIVPPPARS